MMVEGQKNLVWTQQRYLLTTPLKFNTTMMILDVEFDQI